MGMSIGPGQGGQDEPILDINTTPLIDVMLVLLVMLIITIPIQLHAVDLALPKGVPPPVDARPQVVRIDIGADDVVRWNDEALPDRAELARRLQAAGRSQPQPEIHVRPDAASRYATFAAVMVTADRMGLRQLGVLGGPAPPR